MKTGIGSSFWRHFGKKPNFWVFIDLISVAMGVARSAFGTSPSVADLNIPGKSEGHRSRASYISKVRNLELGIFAQDWNDLSSSS